MENHTQLLLEEYKVNVELWKHDDNLRQQRTGNYLTTNSILLVALGILVNFKTSLISLTIIAIMISVFGFLISIIWRRILKRNSQYVKFRRLQLRSIERQLEPMSTFENTYKSFYENEKIEFNNIDIKFEIAEDSKSSSTITEGNLPLLITIFWIVILITSIVINIHESN